MIYQDRLGTDRKKSQHTKMMTLFRFSQDIPNGHNTPPWYVATEFGKFYATCWYSFEALTDSLIAAVCGRKKRLCRSFSFEQQSIAKTGSGRV